MTQTSEIYAVESTNGNRKPGRYIIWTAIEGEENDLRHVPSHDGTTTGTRILNEGWYYAAGDPEPGERLIQYRTQDGQEESGWSPWVVDRVESYPANIPGLQQYSEIVLCLCKNSPVEPDWKPVGPGIVSVDSFGGDVEAFEEWKRSEAARSERYRIVEAIEK